MSTDEEYLDNLLKSMEENPVANRTDFPSIFHEEEPLNDKMVIKDIEPEEAPVLSEEEDWKESLDELLAGAEDGAAEKESQKAEALDEDELSSLFDALESNQDDTNGKQPEISELEGLDVTDLIDHMDGTDDDLNEINDLLKKTDHNEAIDPSSYEDMTSGGDESSDDDMLELLNSVKEGTEVSGEEEVSSKKKKKSFSLSFGKKKKLKENTDNSEEDSENEEDGKESGKKEKGKGFWHRLMEELTREEEEPQNQESVDENEEILKELEAEDQIKEKKKGKKEKKKKDKKGKKNKSTPTGEENEAASGEEEGKKKKKKPKREKKEKQREPKEKSPKILSKKMFFSLIAFCATIIAAIVLLSIFLPDYADKKDARTAFYVGDYSKAYELLYDKNLNQSDQLIFERANVVLKLQRRLDSYALNKKIGKETEALDALLQGTLKYKEILSDSTYGAEEELQVLYQKILGYLEEDYGIDEVEAGEINSYDSETYSRKIYSVVNGEDFSEFEPEEGEEEKTEDNTKLQDVLPEEEDLIQEEP